MTISDSPSAAAGYTGPSSNPAAAKPAPRAAAKTTAAAPAIRKSLRLCKGLDAVRIGSAGSAGAFIDTEDDHLSTFAIDVDTASYTVARRFVQDGNLPDPDSVRVEEFVNYFKQGYEPPSEGAFAIHGEGLPSPFGGDNHWLMRVGLQGKTITAEGRKDATLVFAIDVSGSMGREDRLGLVKRSLRLLVDELRSTDEVGIVIYGNCGSVLLEPTGGRNRVAIMEGIDALQPGGSTYVEDGLRLAYEMAVKRVRSGRITRVLLLSDGVGNVGRTGADSILDTDAAEFADLAARAERIEGGQ